MRILVVEDDLELADILRRALEEQLYQVQLASDGQIAWHRLSHQQFDAVIMDWMIPGPDGASLCRRLRRHQNSVPVIMLTARDQVHDRIEGLDAGADDYLVKPFSIGELLARLRALLRRSEGQAGEVLTVGPLCLDPKGTGVRRGDRWIELTAKEFALLTFLMRQANRVVSRTEILENVWDVNHDGLGNVVDVYINYLRNKLEQNGEPRLIETVRGRGYMLRSPGREA